MATVERTVDLIFRGIDQASAPMQGIQGALGTLGAGADMIVEPLAKAADWVLKIDAALAALAIGGVVLATREAGRFGDAFNEISTLLDATDDDLERFRTSILDYSRTSTASIEDVNAAVYTAISAGTDYRNSIDLLAVSEKLSTAGKADLEATTRLLASSLNAYGASTEEAGRYSDAFFTTVKFGLTTLPELAAQLSSVTSIAAVAGVPIETVGAALAALTAAGNDTSTATTMLAALIKGIIDPSNQAAKAAQDLGFELSAEALAAKGLDGVLQDVQQATGGNIDLTRLLFDNVRSLRAGLTLAADDAGVFAGALEAMRNNAGATDAAFAKMADNFALINQNLVNNIRVTLIQTGLPLLEQYGDTVRALSAVSAAVGISIDQGSFDQVFAALNAAGAQLEDFLRGVAAALPEALAQVDFEKLLESLGKLGGELLGMFDGLDLTVPEDLARAIQAAVDTIASLVDVTRGMAAGFEPVFDVIVRAIDEFNSLSEQQKLDIGEKWLATAKLVQEGGLIIGGTLAMLGATGGDAAAAFQVVTGAIEYAWETMKAGVLTAELIVIGSLQQIVGAVNTLTFGKIGWIDELDTSLTTLRSVIEDQLVGAALEADGAARTFEAGLFSVWGTAERTGPALGTLAGHMQSAGAGAADMAAGTEAAERAAAAFSPSAESVARAVALFGAELGESVARLPGFELLLEDTAGSAADLGKGLDEAGTKTQQWTAETVGATRQVGEFYQGLDGIWRQLPGYSSGLTQAAASTGTLTDSLKVASTDSEEFRLSMAKLTTDFATTALKLNVDMQIAQIQADAQIVTSIMDSLGQTITTTGNTIMGLFGQLGGSMQSGNIFLQNMLTQALAQQQNLQTQAVQAQINLANAQVQALQARSQALQSGQALINIDGTGLSPALQMVMWEIIEEVQLRVNQNAADFLLGLP